MTPDEKRAMGERWQEVFKQIIIGHMARKGTDQGPVSIRIMAVIHDGNQNFVRVNIGAGVSPELKAELEFPQVLSLLLDAERNGKEYTEDMVRKH